MMEWGRPKDMNRRHKRGIRNFKVDDHENDASMRKGRLIWDKKWQLCFIDAKGKGLVGQSSTHHAS